MYDKGGKLLSGIKSMYVDILSCVRIKGGESEGFRINSGVRRGCVMSSWLFNIYMDAVMKEGREWKLPVLLYADDLVLCGESEEDMRGIVGCFVEVCRRCLKMQVRARWWY